MGKLKERLVAYTSLGAKIGPLPHILEKTISTPLANLSTLTMTYPSHGKNADVLVDEDNPCEVGYEIKDKSGNWIEPYDSRFVYQSHRIDHTEIPQNYTVDFLSVADHARFATVYDAYGKEITTEGNVRFKFEAPGAIVKHIWDKAVSRGWGGLSYSFTATHDTAGQPWDEFVQLSLGFEETLLDVIQTMMQQGLADVVWEGRTLHMYKVDTIFGRDKTQNDPPIKFFHGRGQIAAPDYVSTTDKFTHAIVKGEGNKRWVFTNAGSAASGRREVVVSQGGVEDEATAQRLAMNALNRALEPMKNRTREFKLAEEDQAMPFIDFRQGDWVYSQVGTKFETLRIVSLSVTTSADGQRGHVVLGDVMEGIDEKLIQRVSVLTTGKPTTGSVPGKGADPRIPEKPSLAGATTSSYYDSNGNLKGVVEIGIVHSGKATNGANAGRLTYWLETKPSGQQDASWSRVARAEESF